MNFAQNRIELFRALKSTVKHPCGLYDHDYNQVDNVEEAVKFLWRSELGFLYELNHWSVAAGPFMLLDCVKMYGGTQNTKFSQSPLVPLAGHNYVIDKPQSDIAIIYKSKEIGYNYTNGGLPPKEGTIYLSTGAGQEVNFFNENQKMIDFCVFNINKYDGVYPTAGLGFEAKFTINAAFVKQIIINILSYNNLVYVKDGYEEDDVKDPTKDAAVTVTRDKLHIICRIGTKDEHFDNVYDYCAYMCKSKMHGIKLAWSF